jgi:hypothetical protein
MLMCLGFTTNAQTLGTKKVLVLKITSAQVEDALFLNMKDEKTGKTYTISDMVDSKTIHNGIFDDIMEQYYNDGNDKKLKGRLYNVILEYRKTPEYVEINSEGETKKTGRILTKWMINSISNYSK